MSYDGTIRIDTRIDTAGINPGIQQVKASLKQGLAGLGTSLKAGLAAAGISIGVALLADLGKQAIQTASDLEEVQNVVDTVFGSMAQDINSFAETALESFGLSELSAKQFASTMGAMLKSMGFRGNSLKEMSKQLTALAGDMASFYNLDPEDAFNKLRSGISGETEPLKQLGINLNVENLQAYALTQGITKSYSAMTQAEQTMLRYNYILSVTGDAQGDFARTSDSWANQTRLLSESWNQFLGVLGQGLIEILLPLVQVLNQVVRGLIRMAEAMGMKSEVSSGNSSLAESAADAAEGELDLADGIAAAGKAARKALAPFDELNILQSNMGGGSGGFGGGLNFDGLRSETDSLASQVKKKTKELSSDIDKILVELNKKTGKQLEEIGNEIKLPKVVAPEFAPIPTPVYTPEWGLDMPPISAPVFPPVESPVYSPDWGLVPPNVEAPTFPDIKKPVYSPEWNLSIPPIVPPIFPELPSPIFNPVWNLLPTLFPELTLTGALVDAWAKQMQERFEQVRVAGEENTGELSNTTQKNVDAFTTATALTFSLWGKDVSGIMGTMAAYLVNSQKEGYETSFGNTAEWVKSQVESFLSWGKSVTDTGKVTLENIMQNTAAALNSAGANTSQWINSTSKNFLNWGNNFLKTSAEAARGFASNFVAGLKTAWDSFVSFAKSTGEKINGWWSVHGDTVKTVGAVAGVAALTIGTIALSGGTLTGPALAAGAAGIALVTAPSLSSGSFTQPPKLATGAVIPPNAEFMAILGAQRHGRNLEAPEGLIRQIVREESGGLGDALPVLQEILEAIRAGQVLAVDRQVLARVVNRAQADSFRAAGQTTVPV